MRELNLAECDVEQLRSTLETGFRGLVVDVREKHEYAAGRIPGSVSMPLGELQQRLPELDAAATIYVVCRSGRRSHQAQRMLGDLGFEDVRNVRGGYVAWQAMGGGSERDTRTSWTLERQVRFVAGALVFTGVLLGTFVSPPLVWLSGLVGAGLVVAAWTDTCAMGALLAKMPWNRRTGIH